MEAHSREESILNWGRLALGPSRTHDLYEISKLLTLFEGIEKTVVQIVAIIAKTLPLRTAVFIADTIDSPMTVLWHDGQRSAQQLALAEKHARESYGYLARLATPLDPQVEDDELRSSASSPEGQEATSFIDLPLAVVNRSIFGALQLEGASRFAEEDLAFANAVANQLAVAVHRQRVIDTRRASIEIGRAQAEERRVNADRRQADAEQQRDTAEELRQRYEALVDNLDQAFVWEADAHTLRISYMSARSETLLGYSRDRWLNDPAFWIDQVHPDDRRHVRRTLAAVLEGGKDRACLHRSIAANGRVRWFRTGLHLAGLETANPRFQAVSTDVTTLKETEEDTAEQLNFILTLTTSLGEGVLAVDLKGHVTFLNPAAEQLLGWTKKNAGGRPVAEVVRLLRSDGTARLADDHPLRRAIRKGKSFQSDEDRVLRENGTTFAISYTSAPLIGIMRQVTGAVLAFQNIDEPKKAEKQQSFLAEAGNLLASSLDYLETLDAVGRLAVPFMADICVIDEVGDDGTVRRLAPVFADENKARFAIRMAEFAPRPGWSTPQRRSLDSGNSILLADAGGALETVAQNPAHTQLLGELGVQSMMVIPLRVRGGTLGTFTFVNAESGRRYTLADLAFAEELAHRAAIAIDNARLYREAQRAIQARQDVLSVVAHDLNTPLTAILMNLTLILRDSGQDDRRKSKRPLHGIQRSAERMTGLIRDLLDTAGIEARSLSISRKWTPIEPLVADAVEMVQPLATKEGLRITTEVAPRLPPLWADQARIQQVLLNLITNAIKFTPTGGTVTIGCALFEGTIRFSVTDTGRGIAEEDLPHVFDRFWQVRITEKMGSGLGLFIVKGIVEAHGGRIWLQSTLGVGTTCLFALPLGKREADPS